MKKYKEKYRREKTPFRGTLQVVVQIRILVKSFHKR